MPWSTLILLCILFFGASAVDFRSNGGPNILLLFPDQWRFDFDGRNATGDHFLPLQLPTIRQLTQQGTHFLHCYTPSPLCAPARAAVASGRDYDDTGVPDNTATDYNISIPTFYTALGKAGYHVMTVGKDDLSKATQCGTKTHQGDWRGYYHQSELGFQDGLRSGGKWDVVSTPKVPHERYGHWLNQQPPLTLKDGTNISAWEAHVQCVNRGCSAESFPDELYGDDFVTRNAIRLLEKKPKDQPWFLQVNFPGPHPPFLVTPRQNAAVDGRTFPPPVDNPKYVDPQTCQRIENPSPSRIDRCSYAAECEHLDTLFATILNQLDRLGERDNTIVCFSSDHGEMLGDHGLVGKTVPWQGSASVPLICTGPGIQQGKTVHRAVSTKDLAATFLDYATTGSGVKHDELLLLPPPSSSKSLRRLLETGSDDDYHSYIPSGLLSWRMVVDSLSGLKLICCRGRCKRNGGDARQSDATNDPPPAFELLVYNTTNDPFDMHPLNDEVPVEEIARLQRMLPAGFCDSTNWNEMARSSVS